MPAKGTLKQYVGPFEPNSLLNLGSVEDIGTNCIIGISVDEDDFMSWKTSSYNSTSTSQNPETDIVFQIGKNSQMGSAISTIHLGRTFMYETERQINDSSIKFPYGAPPSTKVQIVYCGKNEQEQEGD